MKVPLPSEILSRAFSLLQHQDLCQVSLACHSWHTTAEPLLYREVTLKDYQGRSFARTITNSIRLAECVRRVRFEYKTFCADTIVREILTLLINLESLSISGPWDFNGDLWNAEGKERQWPGIDWETEQEACATVIETVSRYPSMLPRLQEFELSYYNRINGGEWDFDEKAVVLVHKNLRKLVLTGALHGPRFGFLFDSELCIPASTNLEVLELNYCNFETDAFRIMLGLPRALKRLKMTHRNWDGDLNEMPRDATTYFEAVLQQKHSLEDLHLQNIYHDNLGAKLGAMECLKKLDIEFAVLFGRTSSTDIDKAVATRCDVHLPQSLQQLTFRYGAREGNIGHDFRQRKLLQLCAEKPTSFPQLASLQLLRETKNPEGTDGICDDLTIALRAPFALVNVVVFSGAYCQYRCFEAGGTDFHGPP